MRRASRSSAPRHDLAPSDRLAVMPARYFKRPWDESRGDAFDAWGPAVYYFEFSDDGWPIRQIEAYENGPTLRYGPDRDEDEYGQLSRARLDELEDWASWAIASDEFVHAWGSAE